MLTVNMDDALKNEFSNVVKDLGLNATSAINLFARAVIRQKGIPFDITLRTREEQEWNDYLNDELQRGLEDLATGKTYTVEEAKHYLTEKRDV